MDACETMHGETVVSNVSLLRSFDASFRGWIWKNPTKTTTALSLTTDTPLTAAERSTTALGEEQKEKASLSP